MEIETPVENRQLQIVNLYEDFFPNVAKYIKKRGGDLEDAKELFQEALMCLFEKTSDPEFRINRNDEAYLMGIIKNLWIKYQKLQATENLDSLDVAEEEETKPLTQKLLSFLESSGQKCMDLLQSFYYEKLSMVHISERFGYSSERSATVQKYKCLEKVRNRVKQKALSYEDFID